MRHVDKPARGAILVLPGGRPTSTARFRPWQLAYIRVALLAVALRRRLPGTTVRVARYRVRGWNGDGSGPVGDARRALRQMSTVADARDVVLVGHSMGGRVAAHLADEAGAIAALAPWWPEDDADRIPPQCRLLTMHGTADTWTDPAAAREQTLGAATRGVDATWIAVPGVGHFLLRRRALWPREVARFATAFWAGESSAGSVGARPPG